MKRGHAHRRSGAVSSNDLSNILKPTNESRGGSLPTTPSNPNDGQKLSSYLDGSSSQPEIRSCSQDSAEPRDMGDSTQAKTQPRARVGFSDTLEFIPRPLSTISSETSSSLSTIRPGHSVTGSITSIISGGTSSPPSNKLDRLSSDPTTGQPMPDSSPTSSILAFQDRDPYKEASIEDDPLDQASSSSLPSSLVLQNRTTAAPSRSAEDLTYSDTTTPHNSMHRGDGPPFSLRAIGKMQRIETRPRPSNLTRPRSSPEPKIAKRQKKVKSWAESFLPRKPSTTEPLRRSGGLASYTPSLASFAPADDLTVEHLNFDDDTTCVIRDASQVPPSPRTQPSQAKWKHQDSGASDEGDISGPVLDLDAAFEALPTPSLGSDSDDVSEGGFCAARRRMHSSGATGGFSGPGMHYHRRAESAPEMVPIDYHAFGFPRFGSNPQMADVFEEEEEEEEGQEDDERRAQSNGSTPRSSVLKGHNDDTPLGPSAKVVDVGSHKEEQCHQRSDSHKTSKHLGAEQISLESESGGRLVSASQNEEVISSKKIVETEEKPRPSLSTKSPDDYSATPTILTKPMLTRPASAPIDFALHKAKPSSITTDTLSSTVSSPDFSRISFDGPRLHTANSSNTDQQTMSSYRAGEHSINFRASVEDVPSLTSSASTMASGQPPRVSSSAHTRSSAERSSSLSAAVQHTVRPAPASKRSSLASLSRLVGSSYGERSKLHIEERARHGDPDKTEKKKGSRISRMMRFWKSRERLSSP